MSMADTDFSGRKVLLVDDNPGNLLLLKRIISSMRLEAVEVLGGYEALNTLAGEHFDLVLLDIMMPDIDGYRTLQHIREHWDMQQLPVIMMSALDDEQDIIKGLQLGANDYITKPISLDLAQTRIVNQLKLSAYNTQQQAMLDAIHKANEMKSRLMRIASHDLKNPLNNLSMILTLMETAPERAAEYMSIANRSLETMTGIVNEFLDSDILRDNEISVDLQPVEIEPLVSNILLQFERTIEQKGLQTQVSVESATIIADENRMAQVLSNLVSNAIKYTHPNTSICVHGKAHDAYYKLHIIDQGDGISPDEVHRLFKPFSQLSTRPTAGENSTGLGLWIVKQMVEAQGGEVGVNLDTPKGADFWVQYALAT
jgi:two-component system sensor histidine kinase/response regulator